MACEGCGKPAAWTRNDRAYCGPCVLEALAAEGVIQSLGWTWTPKRGRLRARVGDTPP